MSTFSDGFVKGFADSLTSGIEQRRASAQEYFDRQLEIAQTTGVKNRNKAKQMSQEALGVANKLLQYGVPKEIIMAQAKANPAGLGDFAATVEKLALTSGVNMTPDKYRELYRISGDIGNPDEDLATFFNRIYDPLVSTATEDPEGFEANPGGSLIARMFATNAHGRAVQKLGEIEVVDGLSAADLLRYGDEVVPTADPNVTVTIDPSTFSSIEAAGKKPDVLSPSERNTIHTTVDDTLGMVMGDIFKQLDPEDPESAKVAIAAAQEQVVQILGIDQWPANQQEEALRSIQRLGMLNLQQAGFNLSGVSSVEETPVQPSEGAVKAYEEENTSVAPEPVEEAPAPPPVAPTASTVPSTSIDPKTYVISINQGNGTIIRIKLSGQDKNGNFLYRNMDTGEIEVVTPEEHEALLDSLPEY